MKLPLSWLKEFIDLKQNPAQIAKMLTMAGLEVDAIETIKPEFTKVVVGKVLEVAKHPDADKLCVAKVTDGTSTFQVVCGAPNCREGLKTAFAMEGATLKDDKGEFKIKKTKLRGVESFGMLCSAKELNIGTGDEGIIEFGDHLIEGTDIAELYSDTIFEISLTPNLGHCSSALGVARELSAMTGEKLRLSEVETQEDAWSKLSHDLKASIKDSIKCPRYTCRLIRDVKVAPSPEWLQNRLLASDLRPVNNIVDITNYVMLELGHPLHAFDFLKVEGNEIIIRRAEEGETLITLDDKQRILTHEDLVISDKNKAIAVAGVMGGLNSEVSQDTQTILLEAAYFQPTTIRKTSKRLGIHSDASKRFERGTDPNQLVKALNRAAALIQAIAGGKVETGVLDVHTTAFPEKVIDCRLTRINEILGTKLGAGEVEQIFQRLGMSLKFDGRDLYSVNIPTYRNDINEEIDLIEEVARIYGFEHIPAALPKYHTNELPHAPIFLFEREIRDRLMGEGLQEFLTCDLIGPSILEVTNGGTMPDDAVVHVLNPVSIEQSILRTSLLPGLLQVVKHNIDHQNPDIAGFEIGRIHFKNQDKFVEQSVAALVLTGKSRPHVWDQKTHDFDFFDLKGIVEGLLKALGIKDYAFKENALSTFHTGRQAAIFVDQLEIGSIGEVHPAIQRKLDVSQRILFAELNLHDLYPLRKNHVKFEELAKYPASERDWTITLKEEASFEKVIEILNSFASPLLEEVTLLDIYRSDKLGQNLKNVTFHFTYRDKQKTVSQEAVDMEHAQITTKSLKALQELQLA